MTQLTVEQAMGAATEHHRAGRLREAEAIYRQVLAREPNHPDALHLLGLLAHQFARNDAALDLVRRSVQLRPGHAQAHNTLGIVLRALGRLDEAIASYRQSIRCDPGLAAAHCNLGDAQRLAGRLDEAVAACRAAIEIDSTLAEAHCTLGIALKQQGHLREAVEAYREALRRQPGYAHAYNNLGNALLLLGNVDEAVEAQRSSVSLNPNSADAHRNLADALAAQGSFDESVTAYREAIRLQPTYAEAYTNLGAALSACGRSDDAIAACRDALRLRPDDTAALNNLAAVLRDQALLDEAMEACRRAVALRPDVSAYHSSLIYMQQFHPRIDATAQYRAQRGWNERHAVPLKASIAPHVNVPEPDRRIRIGYVSSDFRQHVVGRNLLPIVREHDPARVEVFCYSVVRKPDLLTEQFRAAAHQWRDISRMTDERAAALVREDRIDILIDLTLHMASNRLLLFARKPAPVQVTFGGYPGGTGLDAIDYRLTDPHLDPPDAGAKEPVYSERSVRLSHSFWCYDPAVMTASPDDDLPVAPLPTLASGRITFGCLNNFAKVNEDVLALWGRVLNTVNGSRLMLLAPEGSARQRVIGFLGRVGVAADRIFFVSGASLGDYLHLYDEIDIGLDTFPYNGHSTSLDAMWMGVPVVTLVGQTVVGRAGLSLLTNLGLTDLVAHSADEYVHIAAELARDVSRLDELRKGLRVRMRQSPLTDAAGFARDIEAAYRRMWAEWCGTRSK